MPLLADSIVECGRRTLTNAIMLANQWGNDKCGQWAGAKVVYGKLVRIAEIFNVTIKTILSSFIFIQVTLIHFL